MRIAIFIHYYVPFRCAGSETMLHAMVKKLLAQGHQLMVVATVMPESPTMYEYDGVEVLSTNLVYGRQNIMAWKPDVIVSHHDNTIRAAQMARKLRIPFVFLMHNDFTETQRILELSPSLVVFNTNWMRDKFSSRVPNSMVVHPPVYAEQHATTPGNSVTLVNLNDHKGAQIFYELARRMPDIDFLGVVGGHGIQVIKDDLPNVTIQEHTDEMKQVWGKTGILLMPSVYESYGMAGVEALASGIPVLANPTPGLKESQGPFGLFINRDDIDAYEAAIRELQDPVKWQAASALALKRSAELNPESELDDWALRVEKVVNEYLPSH